MSDDQLQEQLDELLMLQRVDQELNSTLDVANVMMLTIDWAMRRTGASTSMICVINPDGASLIPLATLGFAPQDVIHNADRPLLISEGMIGRAARTKKLQYAKQVAKDPDYIAYRSEIKSAIAAPIEMRGRILGVINLESDQEAGFTDGDVSFIRRLAARAAVALENARLHNETERRAESMTALYGASRIVSSSIERAEVLHYSAQAVADVLNTSSVILLDYQPTHNKIVISQALQAVPAPHAIEQLPTVGQTYVLTEMVEFNTAIRQNRLVVVNRDDRGLSTAMSQFLETHLICSLLVIPLAMQDQRLGAVVAIESRRPRRFFREELMMAESLAGQIAAALRQAKLYEDVRELESLKSEMIRMASHDLRNPLGNAMGYLELLVNDLEPHMAEQQHEFVGLIRSAQSTIKSLIEDLLTLEKVESERQSAWTTINLSSLAEEVFFAHQFQAVRKQHSLNLEKPPEPIYTLGSSTQLRQAIVNLVSNAIKYTPDNGVITVRLRTKQLRAEVEVTDNGYGIAREKQDRLFQRFYRARDPQTEHIPGTGLGLSLVKTVAERHGGEVWVKSDLGKGSTFGFWVPATTESSNRAQ